MTGEDAVRAEQAALRRTLRARRMAMTPQALCEASRALCARVLASRAFAGAGCVLGYAAVRGELSVDAALEAVLSRGAAVLLPRCEAGGRLTARRVRSLEELAPGAFGLLEPPEGAEIFPPQAIDLALVPGVAFGRGGERIGQGGGYYDGFLPGSRAFRLGICHGFALFPALPQSPRDARMDAVATPEEWITIKSGEG